MIVLDTHVLIWAVSGGPRLGDAARAMIDETARTDRIAVSAITPWEIALLVEKGRLHLGQEVGTWIETALALPGMHLAPVEPAIALDSVRLPGVFPADPAARSSSPRPATWVFRFSLPMRPSSNTPRTVTST